MSRIKIPTQNNVLDIGKITIVARKVLGSVELKKAQQHARIKKFPERKKNTSNHCEAKREKTTTGHNPEIRTVPASNVDAWCGARYSKFLNFNRLEQLLQSYEYAR